MAGGRPSQPASPSPCGRGAGGGGWTVAALPPPPAPLPQGEGEHRCSFHPLHGDAAGGLAGEYARAVHVGDLGSWQFVGAWGHRTHTHRQSKVRRLGRQRDHRCIAVIGGWLRLRSLTACQAMTGRAHLRRRDGPRSPSRPAARAAAWPDALGRLPLSLPAAARTPCSA